MEHHSENLVVSVFLLYLVIGSDCSFRIWLDEIRGEGRESFGNNFWAASKKFSASYSKIVLKKTGERGNHKARERFFLGRRRPITTGGGA